MCTMISVFVPRTADVDALEAWSRECGVPRQRRAADARKSGREAKLRMFHT